MRTIAVSYARAHFSALLREVENGETVVITRRGIPIARMMPVRMATDDAAAAVEELHRFRRERRPTLGGLTIRELIDDGRE
jgi:prevent-host-death family protein